MVEYEQLPLKVVCFKIEALTDARMHAANDEREICGICFGRVWKKDEEGLGVDVDECWPVPHAYSDYATVKFTYESWACVLDHLDQLRDRHPKHGWKIVGWYHSHPNFGIFLSGTDQNTHRIYFPKPWHIALVIDPKRNLEGIFYRNVDQHSLSENSFVIV